MPARFTGTVLLELRPPMAGPFGFGGTGFGGTAFALGGGGGGIKVFATFDALGCALLWSHLPRVDGA